MLGVFELDSSGNLGRDQWSTFVDITMNLHNFMCVLGRGG